MYIVDDVKLNNVLLQYKKIFNSELGTLKNVEVKLKLSLMKCLNLESSSFALCTCWSSWKRIRLVNEGIFKPIAHSDWEAPIVPVIKPDASIRICGDYKQTINWASDCDKYPIPRTEDLFALLGRGEKFTKLDIKGL